MLEVGVGADRLAVDAGDDVTGSKAGALGGGVVDDLRQQHATFALVAEALREVVRQVLHCHADPTAHHFAFLHQFGGNVARHRAGHGETCVLIAAAADVGGVDANHLALQVHQRAARVAGMNVGIGVHIVLFIDDVQAGAALGADDARGHRLIDAVGRTKGRDPLADLEQLRVAEAHGLEVRRFDLHNGQVGLRIATDDARGEGALVRKMHLQLGGIRHHMVVGEDVAICRQHCAAAQVVLTQRHVVARALRLGPTQQLLRSVRRCQAHATRRGDRDDARADLFRHALVDMFKVHGRLGRLEEDG